MALRDKVEECLPKKDPTERPDYTEADIQAVRAVFRGAANPDQQTRCLHWLIHHACATYDTSFRPDSARLTDFAEGKRAVGNTILWAVKNAQTKTDPDKIAARTVDTPEDPNARPDNRK